MKTDEAVEWRSRKTDEGGSWGKMKGVKRENVMDALKQIKERLNGVSGWCKCSGLDVEDL